MGDFPFAFTQPNQTWQQSAGGHSYKLQGWFAALAARNVARANVAIIGDSISAGLGASTFARTYPQQLAVMLNARFPTPGLTAHGRGFLAPAPLGVTPWAASSYVTVSPAGLAGIGGYGPGMLTCNIVTGPYTLAYALTGDSADIMWVGSPGFGTGEWKVDAGGFTTFSTSTGGFSDGNITHVSLGAAGAHTLTIATSSAGGGIFIDGVVEYDTDYASGIQVHTGGLSGSKSGDWLTTGSNISQAFATAALQPGLLVIELGVNDAAAAITPAKFASNLTSLIALQRTAYTTAPPVLLLMVYNAYYDGSVTAAAWATYVQAAYGVAAADAAVDVLDLTLRMPPTNAANTWSLYYSDGVHPGDRGHQMIADALCEFLSPA
jgi:lysophospholipase L1-like esterase